MLNWAALYDWGGMTAALVQFSPLIGHELYRLNYNLQRKRLRMA